MDTQDVHIPPVLESRQASAGKVRTFLTGRNPKRLWITRKVKERRRHRRVHVNWPLTIKSFRGAMRGEMKNVSCTGAFLSANDSLRLHEVFSISLDEGFLADRPFSVLAKVVRPGIHCVNEVDHPYGIGVEFLRIPNDNKAFLSAFVMMNWVLRANDSETRVIEQQRRREMIMEKEKEGIRIVVNPQSYPVVKLIWQEHGVQDTPSETTAPLHKDVWAHLAKDCRDRSGQMAVSSSDGSGAALNLFADLITKEIHAEEKRERNRTAYEQFADFVAEIATRTDLDKIRKAQMIHDKASQLGIQ